MRLTHRVKKIEREIVPRKKFKLWVIRDSYIEGKEDPEGKQRVEQKIQEVKEGKIKNRDGTFYQEGDTFLIISRIFTDNKEDLEPLDPSDKEEDGEELQEDKERPPTKEDKPIEERIENLKKRKIELENKLKEK